MAFFIKQHDTGPAWIATLLDDAGTDLEAPVDLTSATSAKFIMRAKSATDPAAPKVSAAATILTPRTAGQVRYDWLAADTGVLGDYNVEVEVTWADGKVETFPNSGWAVVSVVDDLG